MIKQKKIWLPSFACFWKLSADFNNRRKREAEKSFGYQVPHPQISKFKLQSQSLSHPPSRRLKTLRTHICTHFQTRPMPGIPPACCFMSPKSSSSLPGSSCQRCRDEPVFLRLIFFFLQPSSFLGGKASAAAVRSRDKLLVTKDDNKVFVCVRVCVHACARNEDGATAIHKENY